MSTSTNSENQITCKEPSFLTRSSSLPLFTNLSGNIDSSTKLSLPPCFISYNCRLACRDLQRDIAHYKNYSDSPRMVPCMSSHILLPLISDKTLSWGEGLSNPMANESVVWRSRNLPANFAANLGFLLSLFANLGF